MQIFIAMKEYIWSFYQVALCFKCVLISIANLHSTNGICDQTRNSNQFNKMTLNLNLNGIPWQTIAAQYMQQTQTLAKSEVVLELIKKS